MKNNLRPHLLALCGLALAIARTQAELGDQNPTGIAGQFNGNVTTGCSYDPGTGNATRAITDRVVPGAVGAYGLSFTRTWNTRLPTSQEMTSPLTTMGAWRHSFAWSIEQTTVPHNTAVQAVDVIFPDGRIESFQPAGTRDQGYWRAALGTPERVANMVARPTTGSLIYVMLPDGGKLEFRVTRTEETGADAYDIYDFAWQAIIDPYGIRTDVSYPGDGSLTISDPPAAGHWLKIFYTPISSPQATFNVVDYVRGSDGREVHYAYEFQTFPPGTIAWPVLRNVTYFGDASQNATYSYQAPNVGNPQFYPLLSTCDDPMYAGPMKKISYTYATDPNADGSAPAYGQILSENHLGTGQPVSTLAVNGDTRTETRGDGTSRTFHYTGGYLDSWTDFQGHTFSQGRDGNFFVNSYTDARPEAYTTNMELGVTGNLKSKTHPATGSDGGARRTISYGYAPGDSYYMTSVTDENDHTTYYDRDVKHRIWQIRYPDGGFEQFGYNDFNQITSHIMPRAHDGDATDPGGTVTFRYDDLAHPSRMTSSFPPPTASDPDPSSHATQYFYYDSGPNKDRLYRVVDPLSHATRFEYNSRGQVTKLIHEVDNSYVENFYNPDGTLQWTTDENHMGSNLRTSYLYDDFKRVTSMTNPMNEITSRSYKPWSADRLVRNGNEYSHTASFVFRETRNGKVVDQGWDANRRPQWTRTATGAAGEGGEATTNFGYDEVGNLTAVQDPRGNTTSYGFDARNRRTSETPPAPFASQVTDWEYDSASNQVKKATMPEIRPAVRPRKEFEFDSMNRLWKEHVWEDITDGATERITTYERFPSGAVKSVTDPKTQTTFFTYDDRNLKATMRYPNNQLVKGWVYDAMDHILARPTADSNPTTGDSYATQTFHYDPRNRLDQMRWSNAIDFADFGYDFADRLTSAVNPYAAITRQYDDANRLTHDIQALAITPNAPASPITTLVSAVSRKTQGTTTDQNGNQVPQTFDVPLISSTAPVATECRGGGSAQNYTLVLTFQSPVTSGEASVSAGFGSVTDFTPSGNTVTINLTGVATAQRLTVSAVVSTGGATGQVNVPMRVLVGDVSGDGTVNSGDAQITRSKSGQIADGTNFRCDFNTNGLIDSGDAFVVRGQSGSALPTTPIAAPNLDVSYTRNADGQAERLYVPGTSYDLGFDYDETRRLKTIRDGVGGPVRHDYFYDLASNVKERHSYQNNTWQSYGWDQRNRVSQRVIHALYLDGTNPPAEYAFSQEDYLYDPLSRLSRTDRHLNWAPGGTEDHKADGFAYNDRGELTTVKYRGTANSSGGVDGPERTDSFTPDPAGNRASVNANGMLLPYNANSLNQYDVTTNGKEHEVTGYNAVSYRYLADGQLSSVRKGGDQYNLGYDALGRCVRRVSGTNSFASATYYVYAGAHPILEFNDALQVTAKNIYGSAIDELIVRDTGTPLFYHQDRLGSVTAVSNGSGQIAEQYSYEAFGTPEVRTGPASGTPRGTVLANTLVSNRFMFTGREWAATFGFYEYRERAYNPALGRFMSEDPMGFGAGDTNLFRYCAGDPVNRIDPSGLAVEEIYIPFYSTEGIESVTGRSPSVDTFDAETNPGGYAPGGSSSVGGGSVGGGFSPGGGSFGGLSGSFGGGVVSLGAGVGSGGSFASVSNGGALHGETGGGGASPGIGQPGLIGSLVPVYGSARSAIDYFQNGSYGLGSLYVGMVVLDVATLGGDSLFIDAAKVGARALKGTELVLRNPISQHAALRFAERGISEKMIATAVSNGRKFYDVKNGTFTYVLEGGFASGKTLQVGVSTVDGTVTTAIRSTRFNPAVKLPDGSARFIPLE